MQNDLIDIQTKQIEVIYKGHEYSTMTDSDPKNYYM